MGWAKKEIEEMLSYAEQTLNTNFKQRHDFFKAFPKLNCYNSLKEDIQNVRDLRKCINLLNENNNG